MENIKNTFKTELDSFFLELKEIVGTFKMNAISGGNEGDYKTFLSDIEQLFAEDDPVMQILYSRTQLGLLPKVKEEWNAANHTRYEHSIGVTTKCIVVCAYLNSKTEDQGLKLTEQDIRELSLAAALHDVGHLPVSHAVERAFLSCAEYRKEEVAHESRIIPMLLGDNHPLFKNLMEKISRWGNFDPKDSVLRAAYLISDIETEKFIKSQNFNYPRRILQQLLSSEIDMDRLDFLLRDAKELNYKPVTLIDDKILLFIKGLEIRETYCTNKDIKNNIELCIDSNYVQYIFNFLVSRLLMYKDCYFAENVRAFEGLLTHIVSEFLFYGPKPNSEELLEYSDRYFCEEYLNQRINFLPNNKKTTDSNTIQEHLKKQVQAINENKTNRYKHLYSIDLKNPHVENNKKLIPRLKDELEVQINNHAYINKLKNKIIDKSDSKDLNLKRGEFLIDVFSIKEGKGDLLVREVVKDKTGKEEKIKLLKDYMNGSNIHRLYTKKRLDFYHKSDLSPERIKHIREHIIDFFYE